MARTVIVKVPPTNDQAPASFNASATYMETEAKNALWYYNKLREHDGQEPLTKMPKGTKYLKVTR